LKYVVREIADREQWEAYVRQFSPNSFLQSWDFGQFHQSLGDRPLYLGLFEGNSQAGGGLFVLTYARRGNYYACAAGPLVREGTSYAEAVTLFVDYLKTRAHQDRASFIRIRPALLNTPDNEKRFRDFGFLPSVMHLHAERTWVLDLSLTEEEILAAMRKNTRYYVKRAPKDGVSVSMCFDRDAVEILYRLQQETVSRQHFVPFTHDYFMGLFEAFKANNEVALFTATFETQPIASAMVNYYGDSAVYHYAASANEFSKLPGAYAILWAAIKEAKLRGCRYFNFWGVVGDDQEKHPWYGLSRFKKGFGGQEIWYLHAQDLPLSWRFHVNRAIETVRKWKRGL